MTRESDAVSRAHSVAPTDEPTRAATHAHFGHFGTEEPK